MRTFDIVVAADLDGGIGKDGKLPWHLPGDMAFFKRVTSEVQDPDKQNAVIMGRKTWDSIPEKFRPLKGRRNIVLTRDPSLQTAEVVMAGNLDSALASADLPDIEKVFVIGGGAVYSEAMRHGTCANILLTAVEARFDCDVFLPSLDGDFTEDAAATSEPMSDNGITYRFKLYKRK